MSGLLCQDEKVDARKKEKRQRAMKADSILGEAVETTLHMTQLQQEVHARLQFIKDKSSLAEERYFQQQEAIAKLKGWKAFRNAKTKEIGFQLVKDPKVVAYGFAAQLADHVKPESHASTPANQPQQQDSFFESEQAVAVEKGWTAFKNVSTGEIGFSRGTNPRIVSYGFACNLDRNPTGPSNKLDTLENNTPSIPEQQVEVLSVTVVSCRNLRDLEMMSKSDPYVALTLKQPKSSTKQKIKKQKFKTKVMDGNLNPTYNEVFEFDISVAQRTGGAKQEATLVLEVWDKDTASADNIMGKQSVALSKLNPGENETIQLQGEDGDDGGYGSITISVVRKTLQALGMVDPLPATPRIGGEVPTARCQRVPF